MISHVVPLCNFRRLLNNAARDKLPQSYGIISPRDGTLQFRTWNTLVDGRPVEVGRCLCLWHDCGWSWVEWNGMRGSWQKFWMKKKLFADSCYRRYFCDKKCHNELNLFKKKNLKNLQLKVYEIHSQKYLRNDPIKRPFKLQSFQATQSPGQNQLRHSHFWGRFHDNSPRFNAHAQRLN